MWIALAIVLFIIWLCHVEVDVEATKEYVQRIDGGRVMRAVVVRIVFLVIVALIAIATV